MDRTIALILILMVMSLGPSFIIGMIGYTSIQALGRNPSAASKLQMKMLLAFIIALVIALVSIMIIFYAFVPYGKVIYPTPK